MHKIIKNDDDDACPYVPALSHAHSWEMSVQESCTYELHRHFSRNYL